MNNPMDPQNTPAPGQPIMAPPPQMPGPMANPPAPPPQAAPPGPPGLPQFMPAQENPYRPINIGIAGVDAAQGKAQRDEIAAAKDYGKAVNEEKKGVEARTKADIDDANANKQYTQDLLQKTQDFQANMQSVQQKAQQAQAAQLQKVQSIQNAYAADPELHGSFWANQSVGAKVGWALALGLGAFGAARAHSQNAALELFNKAVDEDNQAKQRRMMQYRDQIGNARNSLTDLRQSGLDEQSALLANHNIGLEIFKQKLENQMAQTNDQRIKANGQMLGAQIDQKIAKNNQDIAHLTGQQSLQAATTQAGLQAQKEHLDTQAGIAAFNGWLKQNSDKNGVVYRPTVPGFAPSQERESFKRLVDMTSAYATIHKPVSDLQNLLAPKDANGKPVQNMGGWVEMQLKNPQMFRTIQQGNAELQSAIATAIHMGDSFNPEEQKLVDKLMGGGDLTKLATPAESAKLLGKLDDFFKKRAYNYAQQSGQMIPGSDPLDPEWLEKNFDMNTYLGATPRQQKALTGGGSR